MILSSRKSPEMQNIRVNQTHFLYLVHNVFYQMTAFMCWKGSKHVMVVAQLVIFTYLSISIFEEDLRCCGTKGQLNWYVWYINCKYGGVVNLDLDPLAVLI